MSNSLVTVAMAVVGCSLLSGCGGESSSGLRGAATYNGQPIAKGRVSFQSVDGTGTPFGAEIADGQYAAEKSFPGKFRAVVSVQPDVVVPKTREEAAALEKANRGQAAGGIPEDAAGNSQEVEITGGEQVLDFTITGPPLQ